MPLSNPIISRVAPLKVGGSANAGVGLLASPFDHSHPLVETAGPTDLNLGAWLDAEMARRVAGSIVGRQIGVGFLTSNVVRDLTAMADVDPELNFALKAATYYAWVYFITYQTAAPTTGIRLSMSYTGTVSRFRYNLAGASGVAAFQSASGGAAYDTPLGAAGTGPGTTNVGMVMFGGIATTTAGVMSPRYASGVAGSSVTIASSSFGLLVQQ